MRFEGKENLRREFKSDRKMLPDADLVEACVGFANAAGGELFLGVEDDGEVTGLSKNHEDPIGVAVMIANRTVPSLLVRASLLSMDGKKVLHIEIPVSRSVIATSDGKILRRRLRADLTPECAPLYPYEIASRLSDFLSFDLSSRAVREASVSDFDAAAEDKMLSLLARPGADQSLRGLSREDIRAILRLTAMEGDAIYPTVAGLLLIGKKEAIASYLPTAKIAFQVLNGSEVAVNETYGDPLLLSLPAIEMMMRGINREKEFSEGLVRSAVSDFSPSALREALLNAVCHRDYSILQPIRILFNEEGFTISSPGGFVEGVRMDNLLFAEPKGRNPALSDALKRLGLVEKTGRGIDRIYEGSLLAGRILPEYGESSAREVKLFISKAKPDLSFARFLEEGRARNGEELPILHLLILYTLHESGGMTCRSLSERLSLSEARVRTSLLSLTDLGLVVSEGLRFLLNASLLPRGNNDSAFQLGEEEVMLILEESGRITRIDLLSLGFDGNRAYRLLKKMSDEGKIILKGKGRGAYYVKA